MTTFDELRETARYRELAEEAEHGATRLDRAHAAEEIRRLRIENDCPPPEASVQEHFEQINRAGRQR